MLLAVHPVKLTEDAFTENLTVKLWKQKKHWQVWSKDHQIEVRWEGGSQKLAYPLCGWRLSTICSTEYICAALYNSNIFNLPRLCFTTENLWKSEPQNVHVWIAVFNGNFKSSIGMRHWKFDLIAKVAWWQDSHTYWRVTQHTWGTVLTHLSRFALGLENIGVKELWSTNPGTKTLISDSLVRILKRQIEKQRPSEGDASERVPPLQVGPHPLVDRAEPVHGTGELSTIEFVGQSLQTEIG